MRHDKLYILVICLSAVTLLAWLGSRSSGIEKIPLPEMPTGPAAEASLPPPSSTELPTELLPDVQGRVRFRDNPYTAPGRLTVEEIFDRILIAGERLQADPDRAAAIVNELMDLLESLGPPEASQAIVDFLDSGLDMDTGLGLELNADGFLIASPTLRVALIDMLGRVDPAAAADYAETILASRTSPDEWAVALRNYARGAPESLSQDYLRSKTTDLVTDGEWSRNPTTGYLQAFDLVVHTGSVDLVPELESYLRSRTDEQALAWASFLATDRLASEKPIEVLSLLLEKPNLMAREPFVRAGLFARADVREPAEREILEAYLLRDDLGTEEIAKLAAIFPLHSEFVGPRLVTRDPVLDIRDQAYETLAALETVEQWLLDPRFTQHTSALEGMRDRLAELVASAKRGGHFRPGLEDAGADENEELDLDDDGDEDHEERDASGQTFRTSARKETGT